MPVTNKTIRTSHGVIAISETPGSGIPVLMLHGNSSCKEVFAGQLEGELGNRFHLVAMDLPGHGASSDAIDPQRSYSIRAMPPPLSRCSTAWQFPKRPFSVGRSAATSASRCCRFSLECWGC